MRKVIRPIIIILLTSITILPVYAATVDELQQKINQSQGQLQQTQSQRQAAEAESKTISGSINQLDQQISSMENDLSSMDKDITSLDKSIKDQEKELDKANTEFNSQKELYKLRLKNAYESSDVSYLEILLNSQNIVDLYSKYEAIRSISKHDSDLLDNISEIKQRIKDQKEQLTQKKTKIEETKKQRVSTMNSLTAAKSSKQDYLKKVNSNIEQYKKAEQELQKQSQDFANMIKQIQQAQSSSAKYTGGIMKWPAPGYYTISDPYGPRIHPVYGTKTVHTGLDIAAPGGADIVAASKGTVIYAQWNDGGYGNCVIIDHGGGVTTLYGHCSKLLVKKGDTVNAGGVIAKVGSTGISTGNHLHFEVRVNGDPTDPGKYLK